MGPSAPSPVIELPRSQTRLLDGRHTAHELRSLVTSLVAGWDSMADGTRLGLVREIQLLAEQLSEATSPSDLRLADAPETDLSFLTPRELEVLRALSVGASTAHIAQDLGISVATVRSYVKSLLGKLGVHSRLEAVTLLLNGEAS
jgi:DNA-binding NarL/FixJ family response regulator